MSDEAVKNEGNGEVVVRESDKVITGSNEIQDSRDATTGHKYGVDRTNGIAKTQGAVADELRKKGEKSSSRFRFLAKTFIKNKTKDKERRAQDQTDSSPKPSEEVSLLDQNKTDKREENVNENNEELGSTKPDDINDDEIHGEEVVGTMQVDGDHNGSETLHNHDTNSTETKERPDSGVSEEKQSKITDTTEIQDGTEVTSQQEYLNPPEKKESTRYNVFLRGLRGFFGGDWALDCMKASKEDVQEENSEVTKHEESQVAIYEEENTEKEVPKYQSALTEESVSLAEKDDFDEQDVKLETFDEILQDDQRSKKYEPPPGYTMLVPWRGFMERITWFEEFLRGSSTAKDDELPVPNEVASPVEYEIIEEEEKPVEKPEELNASQNFDEIESVDAVETRPKEFFSEENAEVSELEEENVQPETDDAQVDNGDEEQYIPDEQTSPKEEPAEIALSEGEIAIVQVDRKMKHKFRKQIRAHTKQEIKLGYVSILTGEKRKESIITPTVRRVQFDHEENQDPTTAPDDETPVEDDTKGDKGSSSNKGMPVRLVLVTGEDGSGKTTMLRRYADMAMGRLLTINEMFLGTLKRCHMFARKDFFKLVHYINIQDLPMEGFHTPCELLFKTLLFGLSDEEIAGGYQWLIQYEKSILFIVDELDETKLFSERSYKKIGYHDTATTPTILFNLLRGNIFPHVHILFSSRGHNTEFLKSVLMPSRMYTLRGFIREDMKSLVKTLSPMGSKVWKSLGGKFPNLLIKSKVPLFLLYASSALSDEEFTQDSLVAAMAECIKQALCGKESWNTGSIENLVKLKKLGFQTALERKALVSDEDFFRVELSMSDVQDIPILRRRSVKEISESGDKVERFASYFSHQTLRDFLAALHLCEMNISDFEQFVNERLQQPWFAFLKIQLCSILFNPNNFQFLQEYIEVSDLEDKRSILKKVLKAILETNGSNYGRIELYKLLSECGEGIDDFLRENLTQIRISGKEIFASDVHFLTSLLSRVDNLDVLTLSDCNLSDEVLRSIFLPVKNYEIKIRVLDIHDNPQIMFLDTSLRELCRHCKTEEVDVSGCHLNRTRFARLRNLLKNVELKSLSAGSNAITESSVQIIGEIIRRSGADALSLSNCTFTEGKMRKLKKSLKNTPLKKLNISGQRDIGVQAMAVLGFIVRDCNVEELDISNGQFSNKEIRNFQTSLQSNKMKILDVSSAEPVAAQGLHIIAMSRLLPHVTEELRMINWDIHERSLKMFRDNINKLANPGLKILYGLRGENILTKNGEEPMSSN